MTGNPSESRCAWTGTNRLFEHSIAGVLRADVDGCILDANGAMSRLLGVPAVSELVGRRTADFFSADLREELLERLNTQATIRGAEIRLQRAGGAPVCVIGNLDLAEGESTVIEGTFIEVGDSKCAQERSAHCLSSVLSHVNQAIVRSPDRDSLFAAVCRIAVDTGGFRAAWIGLLDDATGLLQPVARHGAGERSEGAALLASAAAELQRGNSFVVNDLALETAGAPYRGYAAQVGSCALLPLTIGGRLAGAIHLYAAKPDFFDEAARELLREVAGDLSYALDDLARDAGRRRAEEERARLYFSEQGARAQARADARFRGLIEAAPDAIVESDVEGRILVVNAAAELLFGYTRNELLAMRIEDLLPASLREAHAARRAGFFAGTHSPVLRTGRDLTALRKDKTEFPVEISLSRVNAGSGVLVTSIIRDISARQQAEAALVESNRRIASILESITDAFFALDRDWRYTYVNGKAEQLLGRKREDLEGKNIWEEFPELAGSVFEQESRRAAAEQRPVEFSAFDAGRKRWADVHVYPSGSGLSIYFQDASARKALEEQSVQSQRMEALGRLAGGVAHDFNNLLTIIGGYSQMVLDALDGKNPLRKDVEPIAEAATRASALTRQLLAFSRRQLLQPKIVDLNRLITKMNKMLRRVIGEDIELKLALRPDLGRTQADPGQMEQVIMNLAVNARDAMPTGGTLSVTTSNWEAAGGAGAPDLAEGAYVLLSISDTGTGMDERTRTHIFEPFFTTKARGKGTGLGLATAYGIVKQAGGEIRVDSEPGQGACFRIYLPRVRKAAKGQRTARLRRPRKGSETILLVEDEPEVRKLAREMLARLGYRVLEAADADQALALWDALKDSIDLLLTDVIMPHTSGRELAEQLTAVRPGLKVLYMSGYTDEVIARSGIVQNDTPLLQKPFSREALGLGVRAILDAGPKRTPAQ
jgi:hypothetical protein